MCLLLFAYGINRLSHDVTHNILTRLHVIHVYKYDPIRCIDLTSYFKISFQVLMPLP